MQPTERRSPRPALPRPPYRAAPVLLLVLAALTTACPPAPSNNNNNGSTPGSVTTQSSPATSPATSPVPSPSTGIDTNPTPTEGSDDRPIIITGGSLNLYFSHNAYKPTTGGPAGSNNFRLDGYKMTRLRVYDDESGGTPTPICDVPFAGGGSVTVGYKVGANAQQISVRSEFDTTAKKNFVEVTFDAGTGGLPTRPGGRDSHYNRNARLESINYIRGGGSSTACGTLPASRKVTIEIDVSNP